MPDVTHMPRKKEPPAEAGPRHPDAGELKRVGLAFAAFFLVLCSYTMLRPVRDAMAVQFGASRLQWLFSATFVFTLAVVPLFGWAVRRLPRSRVLPAVYGFIILNLLAFHAAFVAGATRGTAAAFFVWLSVFNLFVVSLFWSNLSDCFTTEESHRLYGYISAGGSVGALTGPGATVLLAREVRTEHLLALSALLLAVAAICMVALRRQRPVDAQAAARPIGGSIVAGIPLTARLASLRGIALLVLCYTTVSTVLYVELVDLVGKRYHDASGRTAFFATVDFAVNAIALGMQLLGTRFLVQRFGLRLALPVVPLVVAVCLAAVDVWRSAIAFALVQIVHRCGEYAIGKPGREMIYTTVDPESRYKAKNFIDTAVYRAGDAGSGWLIATIRGAGLDAVLWAAVPAAFAWLVAAYRLGSRHDGNEPA